MISNIINFKIFIFEQFPIFLEFKFQIYLSKFSFIMIFIKIIKIKNIFIFIIKFSNIRIYRNYN